MGLTLLGRCPPRVNSLMFLPIIDQSVCKFKMSQITSIFHIPLKLLEHNVRICAGYAGKLNCALLRNKN